MPRVLVAVLVGLAVSQVGLFLTTVYLHRALAHRAITLKPWLAVVIRFMIWVSLGIKPRQWVAVHRKHHAYTDVEGDPHSPILEGFAMVQFANVALYRRVANDEATVARYARDLAPDRLDKIAFDRALPGLAIGVVSLWLILGWQMALVAAGVHVVTYLLASGAINAIGHAWGKRPFENLATNNQWLALLVAGEGLHNNHHAAPTSARFALAKRQVDPGWWVVNTLQHLGWATIRHSEVKLKVPRPRRTAAPV
ncbi:MAG: fatty acid desaturase [Acidimicrobiales bacterium]